MNEGLASYTETSCREVLRIDAGPSLACMGVPGHAGDRHIYRGHLNGRAVRVMWIAGTNEVDYRWL